MVTNGSISHNSNGHTTDAPPLDPHRWLQERHKPSWRDSEPPVVYSCKWHDDTGLEHMIVLRDDSVDSMLVQIRVLTTMIRQSKAHHASPPQTPQNSAESHNSPQDDAQGVPKADHGGLPYCAQHGVAMRRRSWGGHSHRLADGKWCQGAE